MQQIASNDHQIMYVNNTSKPGQSTCQDTLLKAILEVDQQDLVLFTCFKVNHRVVSLKQLVFAAMKKAIRFFHISEP